MMKSKALFDRSSAVVAVLPMWWAARQSVIQVDHVVFNLDNSDFVSRSGAVDRNPLPGHTLSL
jgi:hypothetical protein